MTEFGGLAFEWDEDKERINSQKHGIAFSVAVKIFENEYFGYDSPRETVWGIEMRHAAVGEVQGRIITVVYTYRYEKIRIISARRAWKKEERSYRALRGGSSSRTH